MLELDAIQVMLETEWLDLRTEVTLVSEDTYWRLYWCDAGDYGDDVRGGDKGGGHVCWQGGRHGDWPNYPKTDKNAPKQLETVDE